MTQHLETLLAELIEASPGGKPPHPESGLLLRYRGRELDPEQAAKVREHLVACRACTAALVDLEELEGVEDPVEVPTENVADYATAAAWRSLQPRLAETEGLPPAHAAPPRRRFHPWIPRLAAVLAAAVVGLGIWVAQLSEREQVLEDRIADLAAPETNPSVLYLDALTRNEEAAPPTLTAGRRAMIFLTPPVEPFADAYRVELQDAQGAPWLTLEHLEPQELGALRLSLIPRPAALGEHRLVLYAEGGETPLATHSLQLVAPVESHPEP